MEVVKAFNSNELHTEIVIKGTHDEPLFRASDIGEILEMSNIRATIHAFDDSEKVVNSIDTPGGSQQVTFLTEKGLYKVLFKSRKPIAETFQNWVCEVIKEIRINGSYTLQQQLLQAQEQLQQTEEQLQQTENALQTQREENELFQLSRKVPTIYIYNIDIRSSDTLLKIGLTNCISERIIPYKTSHPYGKLIFHKEILESTQLKLIEQSIHNKLSDFKVQGEVFRIDIEEAIICVTQEYNSFKLFKNTNDYERKIQLKRIHEFTNRIIDNKTNENVRDMSTQTEFNELDPITVPIIQGDPELVDKFNTFINDHCIVRPDVQVSAKDIIGQYRLFIREAKKEITQAFTDYLKRRFVYDRLKDQTMDQVVLGFSGVKLKEIEYKKNSVSCDEETFIFEKCVFTPGGTVTCKDVIEEFKDWKRIMKKNFDDSKDSKSLKCYLKKSPYLLFETVWSSSGGGQGFYGLKLRRDEKYHRTSSTGCSVLKKNMNDQILCEFETIAKAAEEEHMCAAKMSRSVKVKVIFGTGDNQYYYVKK